MSLSFTNFISTFLLPPAIFLVLGLAGTLLAALPRKRKLGVILLASSFALLWITATPFFTGLISQAIETSTHTASCTPKAIVVLGAGTYFDAPEYGGDTVTPLGLERLRYGAKLHFHTGLPILVSGGNPDHRPRPEAMLMKDVLEKEFSISSVWTETRSNTTKENAVESRKLLLQYNIDSIYVVTQAWHLRRAIGAFQNAGFCVVGTSAGGTSRTTGGVSDYIPSARALLQTHIVGHEILGILWYKLTS